MTALSPYITGLDQNTKHILYNLLGPKYNTHTHTHTHTKRESSTFLISITPVLPISLLPNPVINVLAKSVPH